LPTDDDLLARVQQRATVIRRRQRLLVAGATAAIVVALAGGVVVTSAMGDGRDPVAVAADPTDPSEPVGSRPEASGDDAACAGLESDGDLGPATTGPGGSPTVPTDGSGSETSSTASTTSDPLLAREDPAGAPPAESSPDDPPAATASAVEASSTSCPLHVSVIAAYHSGSTAVDLTVTATAEAFYDAHGFVVWDPEDPVQVDLGSVERSPGSCDASAGDGTAAGSEAEVEPVRGQFQAAHTYPSTGAKEVTVTFWARRCGGPVHQVVVAVTVPI